MSWLEWIAGLSLLFLAWTYAGDPLVIMILARLRPHPTATAQEPTDNQPLPFVSVVMAVHNGAGQIIEKLQQLEAMHYPPERYEIVVVSDGSTDATNKQLMKMYQFNGRTDPTLHCLLLEKQKGKAFALNAGIALAKGELVLLCDVRQRLDPDAIRHLVDRFRDPQVGAVSGELVMETGQGPGMYWRYERAIRMAEANFDSTIGATGALYMIRRSLFRQIPSDCLLDDVHIPMQISLQGYRVAFEPRAKAYDQEASLEREFQRKTRTLAGNFQLLEQLPALLHPFKNRLLWQLISHKLFRLLCPYALLVLLLATTALSFAEGPRQWMYQGFWVSQFVCYIAAIVTQWSFPPIRKLQTLCRTFLVLNLAAVVGLIRYLKRDFLWTR
jgi:cellulose synthase/poly-beta-1,6-N-acetylglucosamine synthase-like glycosyltransferase